MVGLVRHSLAVCPALARETSSFFRLRTNTSFEGRRHSLTHNYTLQRQYSVLRTIIRPLEQMDWGKSLDILCINGISHQELQSTTWLVTQRADESNTTQQSTKNLLVREQEENDERGS